MSILVPINKNARGYIEVPTHIVLDEPELLLVIQSKLVVMQVDRDYVAGIVKFTGLSPEFEPIAPSEKAPAYDWQVGTEAEITFNRR